MSQVLRAAALPGYETEIGRWLWALEEVRRQTLSTVRAGTPIMMSPKRFRRSSSSARALWVTMVSTPRLVDAAVHFMARGVSHQPGGTPYTR